jgi:hypothetical protein
MTKKKRWIYKVYVADEFVKAFTSRKSAKAFMENITEMDLPFLLMPFNERTSSAMMIGELK